jgi:hypothetical protein
VTQKLDALDERWNETGRDPLVLAVVGSALFLVGSVFRVGELDAFSGILNPIGAPPELGWLVEGIGNTGIYLGALGLRGAAASLIVRYRRAGPVEAAQIRWFAVAGGLFAVGLAGSITDIDVFRDAMLGFALLMLSLLPIAIGVAISRYRLYDIDRLINRALVYGTLTAILAGVFTAGVGLGQRLFVAVTGQSSDAAIVGATLVVATLYAPLRKRLEAFVDKRFKYETRRFGSYADRVRSVLTVIDPVRAAENLACEAVAELDATGAAVLDRSGSLAASAGSWPPTDPADFTEIRLSGEGHLGAILLGPRRGSRGGARPYPAEDLAELAEAGRLAAEAVRPA